MSIGLMAEREKKPKGKPGPKPQPERVRAAMIQIRGRQEWREAIEVFADWDRAPSLSDLVDRAIVSYARERGYNKPFPKR